MPRKPDWFANTEPIIERLANLEPTQSLNRRNVEDLFSVRKTEAIRVMKIAGAASVGRNMKIPASMLLKYVESRVGDFKKERRRRAGIAKVVTMEASISPARHASFKLPPVPNFDELTGITFDCGILRVEYFSFEDLMVKMISLSKAMLHQEGRFEEIVEKSLRLVPKE